MTMAASIFAKPGSPAGAGAVLVIYCAGPARCSRRSAPDCQPPCPRFHHVESRYREYRWSERPVVRRLTPLTGLIR